MHIVRPPALLSFVLAALLVMSNLVAGLSQQYCSNQNTASGSSEQSIYQSNGNCQTQCQQDYAFAVVQGQNCWCSDYAPSDQQSTNSCNEKCPGYPYESCGSSSSGLFGYIALNKSPSGTAGAASSSTQPTSQPSTFSTSTSSKTSTTTATPVITTIVSSGNIITVTSTPTVAPVHTELQSSGGISKGAVAGVVVAAFAAIAIVAIGLFLCLRRRRRDEHIIDASGTVVPSRMGSQLSRNGLLGSAFRNNSISHTHHGSSAGDITPVSPVVERRYSKPLVFDQRLNPDLMIHEDSSRVSITTMEDHRDYNRRLNVANPDPE